MVEVLASKRSILFFPLALVIAGLFVIALPSSSNAVTCKLKGNNKVKCPTSKLKGPTGPAGPQGPAGGADPTAPKVSRFTFLATGGAPNTVIQNFTGAVAESSCAAGTFSQARLRSTANDGAADVINVRVGTFAQDTDLDSSQTVTLIPGNVDDQMDLTYMSAGGAQVATAHYSAIDGTGISGVFDCAIFGTSIAG